MNKCAEVESQGQGQEQEQEQVMVGGGGGEEGDLSRRRYSNWGGNTTGPTVLPRPRLMSRLPDDQITHGWPPAARQVGVSPTRASHPSAH